MKIEPYIQKLNESDQFKEFQGKYPDSFLIAGFFVLDFESNQNLHQIDYYLPKENKIAAFSLDEQINLQILEAMNKKAPEQLDIRVNTDLEELKGILLDEMHNRGMTEEIKKIIAVLQNIEGKRLWNLNCVLSGMEILKAHLEDTSKTVLSMEKLSIMDVVKKMDPKQLKAMQGQKAQNTQQKSPEETKETIDKEIDQLDKLKEQLQEQKEKISKG